jgi:hypothetical protein
VGVVAREERFELGLELGDNTGEGSLAAYRRRD